MAATAETLPKQEYAHSNSALYQWGGARALKHEVIVQDFEGLAYDDYISALREMLRTAEGFSEYLDIDDTREHQIIDGQVCNAAQEPMIEVLGRGFRSSRNLAKDHPEYQAQAVRDEGDVITAERVDQLEPGQTYYAISVQPINQLRDPKLRNLYKSLGYREGLLYVQSYSKTYHNTVVAGSFSIDKNDEASVRKWLESEGVSVPEGTDPNEFIRYGFKRPDTPEQAEKYIKDKRTEHYQSKGMTHKRYSVSEFVKNNESTAKQYFNTYYRALADALFTGDNNKTMKSFASTIKSANIKRLKQEVKDDMSWIAGSLNFDDKWAKSMDSVIRYAVVEELRKGLNSYTGRGTVMEWYADVHSTQTIPVTSLYYTNRQLTHNLAAGVTAGRNYGGCPAVELSDEGEESYSADGLNRQGAYGGESTSYSSSRFDDGDCEFISKSCPECGTKNVKTTVRKINGKKHVEGKCGCSKIYN